MSIQQYIMTNIQVADVDQWANDFALSTATSATILAGNVDGMAHLITIVPSASLTSTIFTVTGTDADGHTGLTEDITVVGTTAVTGLQFFSTVTAVTIPAVIADSVTADVGFADDCVGKSLLLDWRSTVGAGIAVNTNATAVTFGIQEYVGGNAFQDANPARTAANWVTSTNTEIDAETTDATTVLTAGITACRFNATGVTNSTTDVTVTLTQPTAN